MWALCTVVLSMSTHLGPALIECNVWLQSQHRTDITTSVLYVNGRPSIVTMDYMIDTSFSNGKNLSAIDRRNDEESVR
jgi:hypothetical protein